ncbi:MAG: FHA domain-containing protein [Oscillospiraceae bacterium]|nr:FHA domain-containing protein [Oscillospiraceae bacterium]
MDLTELFSQYPYLREGITAIVVIFVDICALTILIAAGRERRTGDRRWAKEGRGLMLMCGNEVYPLGAAELLIGRHPSADIHFYDDEISRFHALLTLQNGKWQIEDAGASNGVIVNGTRITKPHTLKRNDVIRIGKRELTVVKGSGKVVS